MGQVHDLVASTCFPPNLKIAPQTSRVLCKDGLVEVLGGVSFDAAIVTTEDDQTHFELCGSPPSPKKTKTMSLFFLGVCFFPRKQPHK